MKILLVDDHVLLREALRGALTELEGEAAIFELERLGVADSKVYARAHAFRRLEDNSSMSMPVTFAPRAARRLAVHPVAVAMSRNRSPGRAIRG